MIGRNTVRGHLLSHTHLVLVSPLPSPLVPPRNKVFVDVGARVKRRTNDGRCDGPAMEGHTLSASTLIAVHLIGRSSSFDGRRHRSGSHAIHALLQNTVSCVQWCERVGAGCGP